MKEVSGKIFLYFFLLIHFVLTAQNKLSLADCISLALKNNTNIIISQEKVNEANILRKTSFDIPKATFQYTQGQFNSIYPYDNILAVNQTIPFPSTFITHSKASKTLEQENFFNMKLSELDLIKNVKLNYYSLCYHLLFEEILKKEENIFMLFEKEIKGADTINNALSRATSETRLLELSDQLLNNRIAITESVFELRKLIRVRQEITIDKNWLMQKEFSALIFDSLSLSHPIALMYNKKIAGADYERKLQTAHLLPDFTIGYFNQSIYGPANVYGEDYFLTTSSRLQGFQASLAIPVFLYPQQQKVKALRIKRKITELEWQGLSYEWNEDIKKEIELNKLFLERLQFFEVSSKSKSEELLKDAQIAYNNKKISAVEYVEVINHSFNVEKNYLSTLLQYQFSRTRLDYLKNK